MGSCQFDLESFVHRPPPFLHYPPGLTVVGRRRRGAERTGVGVSRHLGEGVGDSLAPKNSSALVPDLYGMLNLKEVNFTYYCFLEYIIQSAGSTYSFYLPQDK